MNVVRLLCAALMLMAVTPFARAAELVMVEQSGCKWCALWDKEIGAVYHKTKEGKVAPLRRVNIHKKLPQQLAFINGLVYTPTFVLVHEGREIGRIHGYPGEDFFWGMLQDLLERLPAKHHLRGNPLSEPGKAARKASIRE